MITSLAGNLASKQPTEAVLEVHGVGFSILIPTGTFEKLPAVGKPATLLTYLHVREDALQLFGFGTAAERHVFRAMLGVSGIGPKLALAALSAMRPEEIRLHVVRGEAGFLTRIPGVGRKTAERMIIELRDRFEGLDTGDAGSQPGGSAISAVNDALAALEALGFSKVAADKALRAVQSRHPEEQTAESLIRLALRER
jgi:Holliday junction DNA helicase RuvA